MPKPMDYDVLCTLCSRQGVASSVFVKRNGIVFIDGCR